MTSIPNVLAANSIDVVGAGLGANAGRQQVEAVGVEFESVFLSMMIKEMRNSLQDGGFFGEESSDTFGGLFDLFIGKHLAEAQPLGISEMLVQQYNRQRPDSNSEPPPEGDRTSVTA